MEIAIVRLHPTATGCGVVVLLPPFLGVGGVGGTTTYLDGWQHRCTASQCGLVPGSLGHRRRGAWCLGGLEVCSCRRELLLAGTVDSVALDPREGGTATGLAGLNGGGRCR